MKILNLKMPFLVLYIVAGVIFVGNVVLAEQYFLGLRGDVLGTRVTSEDKKSKSNKELNISKVKNISVELKRASKRFDVVGNEELDAEIKDIANDIDNGIARGIVHVKKVENRPAWKRFLFGPDYKNLGQLRNGLVHIDSGIKKLEKAVEKSDDVGVSTALGSQLEDLVEQREGIAAMIRERESGFSLFGWVSKLLVGYKGGVIEDMDIDTKIPVEEVSESIDVDAEVQEQGENVDEENIEVSESVSEED